MRECRRWRFFLGPAIQRHVRGFAFEHELFFSYFLAKSVAVEIRAEGKDLRMVLSRSAMPEDLADRVAGELSEAGALAGADRLQALLDRLNEAGVTEWRRKTQVRENAGLVTLALLRTYAGLEGNQDAVDGCTVRSVVWPGSHLRYTIQKSLQTRSRHVAHRSDQLYRKATVAYRTATWC